MLLTRRDFCLLGAAGLAGTAGARLPAGPQWNGRAESHRYFGGFRVGLQAATLAKLPLGELIAAVKSFGLKYLEISPAQLDLAAVDLRAVREARTRLLDAGLSTPTYGTVDLNGLDRRRKLEPILGRAQEFGVRALVVDSDPGFLDELDRMATRFRVNIALRNSAPSGAGRPFLLAEAILTALKGRSSWLGVALDTGNLVSGARDPAKAAELLKGRVLDIHLADISATGVPCPLGQGKLDVPGFFEALRKQDYDGPIMLEYRGGHPEAAISASLDYLKKITEGVKP